MFSKEIKRIFMTIKLSFISPIKLGKVLRMIANFSEILRVFSWIMNKFHQYD